MGKNLVIVESPAKARTIEKYLGSDYEVLASYGHVRDLVPKEGAVDPDNDFAMKYQLIERNEKHVEKIVKAVKKASAVYLATDPDREGEAISWHVHEVLKERDVLDSKAVHRVVFHEVTKRAIQEAIGQPRAISERARERAAGAPRARLPRRLQPLAAALEEGAAAAFRRAACKAPRCASSSSAKTRSPRSRRRSTGRSRRSPSRARRPSRRASRSTRATKSSSSPSRTKRACARPSRAIRDTARGKLTVAKVDKKQRRRNPAAPFTTSTLQQEASRKLGFSAQRTMTVAQRLYEGVDIGEGSVGLITYMRTDSVTLADEALRELRAVIADRYGKDNLPDEPRRYKTKAKNAQEAHEAVRPTSASRAPEDVRRYLDANQFRLYELIWKRTVASQMNPAVYDTVALDLVAGESTDGRHLVPRDGLRAREPRIHHRLSGRPRRHGSRRARPHPPRGRRGRPPRAAGPAERAAFHGAAAALLRSDARESARGIRHRPAVDLRVDHLDATQPRIRRDGEPPVHPDRRRPRRQSVPRRNSSRSTSTTSSPREWKTRSTPCRAASASGCRCSRSSGVRSPSSSSIRRRTSLASRRRSRACSARSRERPPDERAHGPLRRVRADRHEGRRGQAEVCGTAARARRWTRSRSMSRSTCSSCRASSGPRPTTSPFRRTSAGSARTCATARSSSRSAATIRTRSRSSARSSSSPKRRSPTRIA